VLQSGLDGNSVQSLFNWVEARQQALKGSASEESESEDEAPVVSAAPPQPQPQPQQQASSAPTSPRPRSPPPIPQMPTQDFVFTCPIPSSSSSPAMTTRQKSSRRSNRSKDPPSDPAPSLLGIKRKTGEPAAELFTVLDGQDDDMMRDTASPPEASDWNLPARPSKRVARR
jgi:hypothetical protein